MAVGGGQAGGGGGGGTSRGEGNITLYLKLDIHKQTSFGDEFVYTKFTWISPIHWTKDLQEGECGGGGGGGEKYANPYSKHRRFVASISSAEKKKIIVAANEVLRFNQPVLK